MGIPIETDRPARQGDAPHRRIPSRVIRTLAFGQLFITVPALVFGVLLVGHFRYQPPPLKKIGTYLLAVEFFESLRAVRFPLAYWLGFNPDFPEIYLDINQADYRKLEFASQHDMAIHDGAEGKTLRRDVEVPATVRLNEQSVPVKVRLKGDRTQHFKQPDRWSFRIETKGDRTLFGMKRFSIQKPVLRNYAYEWFFHQVLKREGIIGLRYLFLEVYVNGRSQGVYALEEHFEKRLLESNERRDGPILRLTEDVPMPLESWQTMAVVPYERKRWMRENPELVRQATYLMEGFRAKRVSIAEAFDLPLLARFFALVDLMEMWHGALPKSLKFYYNPITLKLEPIGFDLEFYGRKFTALTAELSDFREPRGYSLPGWYSAFFGPDIRDRIEFFEAYVGELERLSQPAYLDELFAELEPELERNLDFIYSEIPFVDTLTGHPRTTGGLILFHFAKRKFYERQHMIRNRLRPAAAVAGYLEHADGERMSVMLGNAQKLPIEVTEIVHEGRAYRPAERLLLNEKPRYEALAYERAELVAVGDAQVHPQGKMIASIVGELPPVASAIRYRVPGSSSSIERELYTWSPFAARMPDPALHNPYAPLGDWPFLSADEDSKVVQVAPGRWTLERDLVIPAGYTLRGGPGTTLDLVKRARITTYSPVEIEGTELRPFLVTSSDGTGGGLMVLDAPERSILRHVRFEKLSIPPDPDWIRTSVVTFYRSDVTLEDAVFEGIDAEDALNIIRSNFDMNRTHFRDIRSDAFDSDFSDGRIDASTFTDIGNDAIDVSGTQITVRGVQISGVGDKGLSVGEGSRMETEYVSISGGSLAVAVKDSSSFDAMTLTIRDCDVGFAVFQKKEEFGPATASVWRTMILGVADTHWLERGSTLLYDGSPVASNKVGVAAVLYPDEVAQDVRPPENAPL